MGADSWVEGAILITGSTGLLGSTLLSLLRTNGLDVRALRSDVCDAAALRGETLKHGSASWVIHTAAMTDVGACEREPDTAYAVNAEGTGNVVNAARAAGARMLYISTASVFSGKEGDYRETDVPTPENIYNTSKAKGEGYVLAYDKGTVLRLNLIGVHSDGSRGKNFMEWLIDSVRADRDINAFADVMINPLSNWTIADCIKKILEREPNERILHIASSDVRSKADIVEMVASRFPAYKGTITRTSVDIIKDGVVRPKEMWLNCDYTRGVLGITMPSIASEIDTIFAHL